MNRRQWLQAAAGLAASSLAVGTGRLWAAPAADARFLLVFLRGGYDAANLLVPVSSSFYYESRPNIAIPKPGGAGSAADAALPLDADWGLHPALRDSLYPLFQKKEALFIPFAGTDDTSRSHFETQDSIELGQPQGGAKDYQSGFLNRLAASLQGREAIAFTDQLPIAFRGSVQVSNMALKNLAKPAVDARQAAIIAGMYEGTRLAGVVSGGFAARDQALRELAGEMETASRSALSAKSFEGEARRIARLMRERYALGFVDVGGWDTHVGEGGAKGYLADRFAELGRGLAGFADDMGPAWRKTVVVVISEFGRTFRENGNRGTDHGHGTVYWVLGGGIQGGMVSGEQVPVTAATLFQNRDYPVLNDYRAVLGGVFGRLFGLDGQRLDGVFPGTPATPVSWV